jgi:general secretion pathway protein E
MPLREQDEVIVVALANPENQVGLQGLAWASGKSVQPWIGLPSEIEAAFERLYGEGRSAMGQIVEAVGGEDRGAGLDDIEHLKDLASEAPVIRLVNLMISRAVDARASDIHIEPFERQLKVRYRIDGVLVDIESPPLKLAPAVISRLKLIAKLNIAERRLPQDGRIQLRVQGKEIDLRISTVPTLYGESVVMRVLDKRGVALDFTVLGLTPMLRQRLEATLQMPHGIVIVAGPTGSGKTTTLYAALRLLNTSARKILTVEDPVEYQLDGINQMQVKPQIGLTFANGLRAIVRQDPDVIMIGEIRDGETAGIAVQSALTGHLVLSTLHANSAAGAITRLLDMGAEDYLLTSTINATLAQRLVRILCTQCKRGYDPLPEEISEFNLHRYVTDNAPIRLYQAVGCPACAGTGYWGRTGIVELLVMSDALRRLILQHADANEMHKQALAGGMETMYEDGLRKVIAGITTLEEVLRVTQEGGDATVSL